MRFDAFFHGRERDKKGEVTAVDVYPRGRVPCVKLVREMELLLQVSKVTIDTFNELTHGVINETLVREFGRSDMDATRGRKRMHDPVTNAAVLNILGDLDHDAYVANLRTSLAAGVETLGEDRVPSAGTSPNALPIHRKLRLPRDTSFTVRRVGLEPESSPCRVPYLRTCV